MAQCHGNLVFPVVLILAGFMVVGCGKSEVNKPEVNKVRTASVVIFTVPLEIEYGADSTAVGPWRARRLMG